VLEPLSVTSHQEAVSLKRIESLRIVFEFESLASARPSYVGFIGFHCSTCGKKGLT